MRAGSSPAPFLSRRHRSDVRVKVTNHNPPGGSFHTPSGFVDTDKDGVGNASADQVEHLKKRGDLKVVEVKESAKTAAPAEDPK